MNKIFKIRNELPYNLRQNAQFSRLFVKSLYYGNEILSYLGPKVSIILPNIYRDIDGVNKF